LGFLARAVGWFLSSRGYLSADPLRPTCPPNPLWRLAKKPVAPWLFSHFRTKALHAADQREAERFIKKPLFCGMGLRDRLQTSG